VPKTTRSRAKPKPTTDLPVLEPIGPFDIAQAIIRRGHLNDPEQPAATEQAVILRLAALAATDNLLALNVLRGFLDISLSPTAATEVRAAVRRWSAEHDGLSAAFRGFGDALAHPLTDDDVRELNRRFDAGETIADLLRPTPAETRTDRLEEATTAASWVYSFNVEPLVVPVDAPSELAGDAPGEADRTVVMDRTETDGSGT
jgi:hypothetical protein